jgi:hypothetical protein
MTGEELVQALLDRIAAKRARIGEFTIYSRGLEDLLREALLPPERRPEPGYPKKMTRPRPNEVPWVPKGPEPPEVAVVTTRREEDEAYARGFRI